MDGEVVVKKTRDPCYVICPHCGYRHGDTWEWVKNETPERMNCESCAREFLYWMDVQVEYYAKVPDPEGVAKLKACLKPPSS